MPVPVSFPVPDAFFPGTDDGRDIHLRQLAASVRGLMDGNTNAAFDFDLQVSPAVTTTVTDARVAATTRVILVPMNAAAVTHPAAGTVRITEVLPGSFTITHLPSPVVRSFRASLLS
jgi:hypothetical protein